MNSWLAMGAPRRGSSCSGGMGEIGKKAGFQAEGLLQLSSEGRRGGGQVRRGLDITDRRESTWEATWGPQGIVRTFV